MALVVKDRVKQTTTTTGTGNIVLNGNIDGFQTFAAALTDGDTTYFGIFVPSTNDYEVGLGTWTEGSATLARTTILESSNSGSAINITAQAEVFITQPAEKAVFQDANGDVDLGSNKILFGNVYSGTNDLPSASTYHGMFAHVHGTGKAYYAHGGNWIELVNEDTSGNVSMGGNLTVTGDLTVNGTTTTVSTTNTVVKDSLIELGNGTSGSPSNDAGIVIERGSSDNAFIGYDESADKFTVGTGSFTGATTGNLTISTGTLVANVEGNVTGNVTGNTSGSSGSTTGNAATATALATARNIGGVSFDGTGNINLPGVNTSGNQDTSGNAATATTAGTVTTAAQTNITSLGTLTTLTVDDITINGSTISDGGDLTLDVGGDIILDADGAQLIFKDAGTTIGGFNNSSSNLNIFASVNDKDITFTGEDNGSTITALSLDMSAAGNAIFNNEVFLGDSKAIVFGASSDLKIYHDGSNSYIDDAGTGRLYLRGNDRVQIQKYTGEDMITAIADGAVKLYHNNSNKLETTSSGVNINGDLNAVDNIYLASKLYHEGDTDTYTEYGANTLSVITGGTNRFVVNNDGVRLGDTGNGYFQPVSGDYGSIQIDGGAHNSWEGYSIGGRVVFMHDNNSTSGLYNDVNNEWMAIFRHNAEVELHYNGIEMFATTSDGAHVKGNLYTDGSLAEDYDALSGTTPTCNVDNGGMFSLTMSGNTTFTFSGASSGYIQGFVLQLTGNGSTVTWPGSVKWAGGTAPDAPANGETDILSFVTRDGGTNWYGVLSSDAAA